MSLVRKTPNLQDVASYQAARNQVAAIAQEHKNFELLGNGDYLQWNAANDVQANGPFNVLVQNFAQLKPDDFPVVLHLEVRPLTKALKLAWQATLPAYLEAIQGNCRTGYEAKRFQLRSDVPEGSRMYLIDVLRKMEGKFPDADSWKAWMMYAITPNHLLSDVDQQKPCITSKGFSKYLLGMKPVASMVEGQANPGAGGGGGPHNPSSSSALASQARGVPVFAPSSSSTGSSSSGDTPMPDAQ
jgi:hypothetical protein